MRNILLFFLLVTGTTVFAQKVDDIINTSEVKRIEQTLSSDDMQGRKAFTPGIEKAADFIINEFKSAGLKSFGNNGYRQSFAIIQSSVTSVSGSLNGGQIPSKNIQAFTSSADLRLDQNSGYEKAFVKKGDSFIAAFSKYTESNKNYIVFVDTSFATRFPRLAYFNTQQFKSDRNVVFVLSSIDPDKYEIHVTQNIKESKLTNIAGMLPGTTKKDEYVIFSAHYDHLGVTEPNDQGDSVFNGANDDASGVTAVIMLAKYFSKMKNNARTLIFVTFTAEELGEYGSQYFSGQLDPAKVMAMFNIEMIGTESKWGINSAYITGYDKTDMAKILEKNLTGSKFTFYPDPYLQMDLFYRSDNASLAKLGVPAHTISTSKMDSEKHYHKLDDEIGTLNIPNMTEIIKSIAISSRSIVAGVDTPSRVSEK